jgi:cyclophilin family peptidyl-prolyl cis-trans isomerase
MVPGMATPFPPFDGSAPKQQQFSSPPEMGIDPDKRYTATMDTSMGELVIALDAIKAPKTVNNFVFLALNHYYDGIVIHRIINGFVCQGGDPTGTGRGGPGYKFADECKNNPLKHERGVISMANAGPNTNGSQFFITHVPTPHLNGKHTVFGKVTKGADIVDAIKQGDVMVSVKVAA